MSDLIDRNELIDYFCQKDCDFDPKDCALFPCHEIEIIKNAPSVQPRRGKWAGKGDSEGFGIFICDNCGKFAMMEFDFCPNCVASMRPQFEEPEINPCRGCEDYDWKGGCKSKGGCAKSRGEVDE